MVGLPGFGLRSGSPYDGAMKGACGRSSRFRATLGITVSALAFGCAGSDPVQPNRGSADDDSLLEYRVHGLIFASGVNSTAHDVNDVGVVVGVVGGRAALWAIDAGFRASGPFELELPGGGDAGPSEAMGLNDLGQVVGSLVGDTLRPFIWTEAGGLRELPLPSGAEGGVAYDINEAGQIVGSTSADPTFANAEEGRVALWTVDGDGAVLDVMDIGVLDGTGARGHAINEAGQIAGIVWYGGGTTQSSFVWHPVADLEKLPLQAESLGMNNRGAVVGSFEDQAAMWRGGELEAVGPARSVARAINDDRLIVGEAAIGGLAGSRAGFAILFGQLHVLETLSAVEYALPRAVNGDGIIVGDLFTAGPDGSEAAFWVPR